MPVLDFCLTSASLCPVDLSDNRDTWGHVEQGENKSEC